MWVFIMKRMSLAWKLMQFVYHRGVNMGWAIYWDDFRSGGCTVTYFFSPSPSLFFCLFTNPAYSHTHVSLHPLLYDSTDQAPHYHLILLQLGSSLSDDIWLFTQVFFFYYYYWSWRYSWAFQWTIFPVQSWRSSSNSTLTCCLILASTEKDNAMYKLWLCAVTRIIQAALYWSLPKPSACVNGMWLCNLCM